MSIQTFPNSTAGLAAANAVGQPRDVAIDRAAIYVYDGATTPPATRQSRKTSKMQSPLRAMASWRPWQP